MRPFTENDIPRDISEEYYNASLATERIKARYTALVNSDVISRRTRGDVAIPAGYGNTPPGKSPISIIIFDEVFAEVAELQEKLSVAEQRLAIASKAHADAWNKLYEQREQQAAGQASG